MNIKVVKRDGSLELLDFSKITEKLEICTKDLDGVSIDDLGRSIKSVLRDGIKSEEIQDVITNIALENVDQFIVNYEYVAARSQLINIYHNVYKHWKFQTYDKTAGDFLKFIHKATELGLVHNTITSTYSDTEIEYLNTFIKSDRDKLFKYIGIKSLQDRYLIKYDGKTMELPQWRFLLVSMMIAIPENHTTISAMLKDRDRDDISRYTTDKYEIFVRNIPSDVKDKIRDELGEDRLNDFYSRAFFVKQFYDGLSQHLFMSATPTLSNAGTVRHQLSSCYVSTYEDSLEGICNAEKEFALHSKYGGGDGRDITSIRAQSSVIGKSTNAAGGVIPFMKILNDYAIAYDQLGVRKGVVAPSLQPWHMDILDFIDLKKNSGDDRRRAHELFPAVWIPDLFMERVESDGMWTLFDPYETKDLIDAHSDEFTQIYTQYESDPSVRKITINARDLWKRILTNYYESGSPFLCFKDAHNRGNMNPNVGSIRSSNLCTEISLPSTEDVYGIELRLSHVNSTDVTDSTVMLIEDLNTEVTVRYKDEIIIKLAKDISSLDTIVIKSEEDPADTVDLKVLASTRVVIKEGMTSVCNLASINLPRAMESLHQGGRTIEERTREYDYLVATVIRFLDNVITLNFYPTTRSWRGNNRLRATGLGIMGESEYLATNQIMYGSTKHYEVINDIYRKTYLAAISASSDLGKYKGSYPEYTGSVWSKGVLPHETVKITNPFKTNVSTLFKYDLDTELNSIKDRASKWMRNGQLLATAPTSSISLIVGTTPSIEPVYKRKWFEENSKGIIPVLAPKLSAETWEYYIPYKDVNQFDILKTTSVRQYWADQAISMNIQLGSSVSLGYLNKLYMTAWKLGLKSCYYLRSESAKSKVLDKDTDTTDDNDVVDRSIECEGCQ